MRRQLISGVVLLAAGLASSASHAQQVKQQGTAPAAIRSQIEALWVKAADRMKAGDAVGMAALYTADASLTEPGMPTASGRAAVEKSLREAFATSRLVSMSHTTSTLDTSGDLAVQTGTMHQVWRDTRGKSTASDARYTLVFKRVNGQWLALRDASTPMPPAKR